MSEVKQDSPIRVLVAKPGLDGHDRGAKIVARALRDAGMEVIYTGLRQTAEQIASAAIQEDVDVIACSILSGAHNTLLPKIYNLLCEESAQEDILFIAGGVIPDEDIPGLKEKGVAEIFTPGTPTNTIIDYIQTAVKQGESK
ncbi:MAG: methylmalonyl-CoA mutase [Myxococcales bacterium]|nr:methylmalonyl-CoA mutase [Myxococcales bacterium]